MATLQHPLTPSVAELRRYHGHTKLRAAALVNDLLHTHPDYARGVRRIRIPERASEIATVDDWLSRAGVHYARSAVDVLHGRLVIIGLALTVPSIRDDLIGTKLLQALASEIKEGVPTLLTPQARVEWERIEAAWQRTAAAPNAVPEPARKAPSSANHPAHEPVSDHGPDSAPESHAGEEAPPASQADKSRLRLPEDPEEIRKKVRAAKYRNELDLQAPHVVPAKGHGHEGDDGGVPASAILLNDEAEFQGKHDEASAERRFYETLVVQQKDEPESPALAEGEAPVPRLSRTDQETVPAHPDDPAVLDTLARRPFARCIADRMDEVWKGRENRPIARGAADTGSGGAFMLHLHGPWGSGKSSILNFLRDELQGEQRRPDERWVVVEFNAWRHQRIRPPWWTLIRDVYAQSARQLSPLHALWLRVRWWAWRVRADWLPVAAAAVIITLAVLVITGVIDLFPEPVQTAPGTQAQRQADEAWKGIELALKLLTAALAAWGALFAVSRSLAFGSARAAQAYTELKSDPLGPIVRLFQRLTDRIGRPVAVFIDDLDRCDGKYVVELLEGIQTLFRTAPVTYVVAADRKWICASFQQGYKDFGDDIGEAGRPLGYLFLDKLFQVSASVPRPSPGVQRAYWGALLRAAGSADAAALEDQRRLAEEKAAGQIGDRHTTEALQAFVAAAPNKVEEEGRRAVAAQRITTAQAQHETQKHLLEGFADLLEPNPRSMKRLVNAYGLHQATHFLEHRSVPPDALARWTIVELRWPLLADHLASHPESVAGIRDGKEPDGVPDALKPLFRDPEVRAVVGNGGGGLDVSALRQIVGSVDAEEAAKASAEVAAEGGVAAVDEVAAGAGDDAVVSPVAVG